MGRPEMRNWRPSRFELALVAVLLAVFFVTLELVEAFVTLHRPF
jgi:hypothetical protein